MTSSINLDLSSKIFFKEEVLLFISSFKVFFVSFKDVLNIVANCSILSLIVLI